MKKNYLIFLLIFTLAACTGKPSAEIHLDGMQQKDRFTIHKTENMWNFILLDTFKGRVWQCQFSIKGDDTKFCIPIDLEDKSY